MLPISVIKWPINKKRTRLGVEGELPVEPICLLKFVPLLAVKKAEIKKVLDDIIHSFDATSVQIRFSKTCLPLLNKEKAA